MHTKLVAKNANTETSLDDFLDFVSLPATLRTWAAETSTSSFCTVWTQQVCKALLGRRPAGPAHVGAAGAAMEAIMEFVARDASMLPWLL